MKKGGVFLVGALFLQSVDAKDSYLQEIYQLFRGGERSIFGKVYEGILNRNPELFKELLHSARPGEVQDLVKDIKLGKIDKDSVKLKKLFSENRINHARFIESLVKEAQKDPAALKKIKTGLDSIKKRGFRLPSVARCGAGISVFFATGDWWHSFFASYLSRPDLNIDYSLDYNLKYTTTVMETAGMTFMSVLCLTEMVQNKERFKETLNWLRGNFSNKHIEELKTLLVLVQEDPVMAKRVAGLKYIKEFDDKKKDKLAHAVIQEFKKYQNPLSRYLDQAWSDYLLNTEIEKMLIDYANTLPVKKRLSIVAAMTGLKVNEGQWRETLRDIKSMEDTVSTDFLNWLQIHSDPEEFKLVIDSLGKLSQKQIEVYEKFHGIDVSRKVTLAGLGVALSVLSYHSALGPTLSPVDREMDHSIRETLRHWVPFLFGGMVGGPIIAERVVHAIKLKRGIKETEPLNFLYEEDIPYLENLLHQAKQHLAQGVRPTGSNNFDTAKVDDLVWRVGRKMSDKRKYQRNRENPFIVNMALGASSTCQRMLRNLMRSSE